MFKSVVPARIVFGGLLILLSCLGCAGGPATTPHPAKPDAPEGAAARELPALHALGSGPFSRIAAASSGELLVDGDARVDEAGAGNRTVPETHAYIIQPGASEDYAWALYAIPNLINERPVEVSFEINAAVPDGGGDPLPLSCMVGVANYTNYTWDWFGPFSEPTGLTDLLPLNSADLRERYVNADGVLHIVVVTPRDESFVTEGNPDGLTAAEIVQLRVGTLAVSDAEYMFTKPHFAAIDTLELGQGAKGGSDLDPDQQYVTLTWTHVEDPADEALEAQDYTISRRGPTDDAPVVLGVRPAPEQDFTDPLDNDGAPPAVIPGATYTYFLLATNAQGSTPLSQGQITIPLLAPVLTASDGDYADHIALSWTAAEGATGYEIYRDTQDGAGLLATVGAVTAWDDTTVADYLPHSYWLKSLNDYAHSDFSNEGVGSRSGTAPVADLQADPSSGIVPLTVNLDASASYDPDDGDSPGAGIVSYDWDWESDGIWDVVAGDPVQSHVYDSPVVYTVRLRVTDNEGTQDMATAVIEVHFPPPPQDLICTPERCCPAIDELRIDYLDPVVRRFPRLTYNPISETFEPADPIGFNDVLKTNGDEFAVSRVEGTSYPVVAVMLTDDPNDITSPDDNIPGVFCAEVNPHRVIVDISAITPTGQVGDPDKTYSYKLFGADLMTVGQGVFNVAPLDISPGPPVGQHWGVNVWNREEQEIADRYYDNFTVNGSTIGAGALTPDVIWLEFGYGWVYDFSENPLDIDSTNNVKLHLEDEATFEEDYMSLKPVLIGINVAGDMIAIHPVVPEDFVNPEIPGGGPGHLRPGHTYIVGLDDPHYPGIDWTFEGPSEHVLTVTGTNPNV